MAPRILIVEDHPLFLDALQSSLQDGLGGVELSVAESLGQAKAELSNSKFDLVLLDIRLPDSNGLDGLKDIRVLAGKTPVGVISALHSGDVIATVKAGGASGFIHKGLRREEILDRVRQLLKGEQVFPPAISQGETKIQDPLLERLRQLTPQQLKVLQRVCEAKLNKQIAFEMGVTETTVKAHITLIFKKLGVHSRTQALLQLQRLKNELEETEFATLLQAAETGK